MVKNRTLTLALIDYDHEISVSNNIFIHRILFGISDSKLLLDPILRNYQMFRFDA